MTTPNRCFLRSLPALMGLAGLLFLSPVSNGQFYNGSQLTFGKSRVQYSDFIWQYYRFEKFDTYFYMAGRELALYTAEYADKHIREIETELQSTLEEKIQFIVFNNLSDLKESNIGLFGDWDYYNTGGVTRIIGGRVLLYFDGHYENFERQIRAGIAQVILNNMIYGTGIGAQIKNNALFTVPEWYMNGLTSYVSRRWDPEIENFVRDAVLNRSYRRFNGLSGEGATFAGHSLWHFIAVKYGRSSIPNIVYMARLSRNVERGFQYVIGLSFPGVIEQWRAYYSQLFSQQELVRTPPPGEPVNRRNLPDRVFRSLKMNPDGNHIAYATHDLGIYKVFIQDLEKGKKKRVFRGGYRLADRPDYTFPLLAWHPGGRILAIMAEQKGEIRLFFYDRDEKKLRMQRLVNFQKVLDFSYSDDGSMLVMSAVQRGRPDIFVFNIASGSHQQITRDNYDDLNPRFINFSKDIIFSSNRPGDTIRFDADFRPGRQNYSHDLFLYSYSAGSNVLKRITSTPGEDELRPMPYGDGYFSYLSDRNGVMNRFLARYDSAIAYIDTVTHYRYFTTTYPVTNYQRNILEQDISVRGARLGEVVFINNNYRMFARDLMLPRMVEQVKLSFPPVPKPVDSATGSPGLPVMATDTTQSTPERQAPPRKSRFSVVRYRDIPGFEAAAQYASGGGVVAGDKGEISKTDTSNAYWTVLKEMQKTGKRPGREPRDSTERYSRARQMNYNVEYYIDQMVTQIDFTYLNFAYQPFTGSAAPIFINPGLNALLMVGVSDLMEDYRISGGVRLNVNLINNEYLFSYGNYRRRVDHQLVFHRKSVEVAGLFSIIRHRVHELYYAATYPFSPVLNLRGTAALRYDRAVFLATDQPNLAQPDIHDLWGSIKGELTYDNTRSLGLNLYKGTRYKLFGEYYQLMTASTNNVSVVGLDIRNYQVVHRTLIWANRFAASTSFGSNKLLYYMGGVDNWLFPTYDPTTPIAYGENYAFQTLATNMRGFSQNIRNGNSFFLFNSELRWPIFRYLFNRPIRSDFLNNFQIVAFGDVGTAWTGTTPWSDDNQFFTRYIYRKPLFIKVEMQKEPLVEGFGFGARTRLFGYFLRGDLAWGVEDGRIRQPVFYFSLSLDF